MTSFLSSVGAAFKVSSPASKTSPSTRTSITVGHALLLQKRTISSPTSSPSLTKPPPSAAGDRRETSTSAFIPSQVAALIPLADEALAISLGNLRDEGVNHYGQKWVKTSERKELNLTTYQSTVPGNSLVSHKAVCMIKNISPEKVMAFFVDDIQRRLAWDKGLTALEALPIADYTPTDAPRAYHRYMLKHLSMKGQGPVSSRDFVDLTVLKTLDDGSIIHVERGLLPHETYGHFPEVSSSVRAQKFPSCMLMRRHGDTGDDCLVTLCYHLDIKGWFSASVVNSIIGNSFVGFFSDLNAALNDFNVRG